MIRRLLLLVLTLPLLTGVLSAQAQGDDVDTLVDTAIAYLGQQLGTPLTRADVTSWFWEETYWPDTSLACPQPDQVYTQETTRGYIIQLTVAGTVYEVHITADGQTTVLCGSEAAPPPTPIAPAAATPVSPAPLADPEALVDAGLTYLSAQLARPITRSQLTRWTWEEVVWPDSSLGCPQPDQTYEGFPVRGYNITLEYMGTAYELHMTPDGSTIMPCNNPLLTPLIAGTDNEMAADAESAGTPATAAETGTPLDLPLPTLIYTGPDGNVVFAAQGIFPGQAITDDVTDTTPEIGPLPTFNHLYGYYRWSPDGTRIAFVDNVHPYRLLITDAAGAPPRALAEGLTPFYPPTWSPDGSEIAYVTPTQTFRGSNQVMAIYAVTPPTNGTIGEPRLLGIFEQEVGCGGGPTDPATTIYMQQAGFGGNALTFIWLPGDNFLFTTSCTGVGLARLDINSGEVIPLDPQLARISLSPDRRRIAGIVTGAGERQLVITDLLSGERQVVPMAGTPDQVLWSADGSRLYVSTVDYSETLSLPDGSESADTFIVRLWEVDLTTGDNTLRFEQEGRGIGNMAEAPDGGLIFTFIDSVRGWLEVLENGGDIAAQRAAAPASWLLLLNTEGYVSRLGRGGHPAPQPLIAAQG